MKNSKLYFKQLFCKHFWKEVSIEALRKYTRTICDGEYPIGERTYFAVDYVCVKCGKEKMEEERYDYSYSIDEKVNMARAKKGLPKI